MNNQTYVVNSVSEYLEVLKKLESQKSQIDTHGINKHRHLLYRGHPDSRYELVPKIYRDAGWIENEHEMFRRLIHLCPEQFPDKMPAFQALTKMQHYGLPTRLLDLTENPLVALFFACDSNERERTLDGEVVHFKFSSEYMKFPDSDTVSVIANLAKQSHSYWDNESIAKTEFNQTKHVKILIHDIRQEKMGFEAAIDPEHIHAVVCVRPKFDVPRVVRQDAMFLLFGIGNDKRECAYFPEGHASRDIDKRILIPTDKKSNCLYELEKLGINKIKLFPEIDAVAKEITAMFLRDIKLDSAYWAWDNAF